jgi:hypothetical protein
MGSAQQRQQLFAVWVQWVTLRLGASSVAIVTGNGHKLGVERDLCAAQGQAVAIQLY